MLERWDSDVASETPAQSAWTAHHVLLYSKCRRFIAALPREPQRIIADVACGFGTGYDWLHDQGRYVGIDGDTDTLKEARSRRPLADFRYGQIDKPDWLKDRPDVIVSTETAEHLPRPDAFLRSCRGRLAEGGYLLFSAPTCLTRDFDPYHRHDRSEGQWRAALGKAGFYVLSDEKVEWSLSFGEFCRSCPTTWRQKMRVAIFSLSHPQYLLNRLRVWIWGQRFEWSSHWFACRASPWKRLGEPICGAVEPKL